MKTNTLIGIIVFWVVIFSAMSIINNRISATNKTSQEWFDNNVTVSDIVYDKHEYRMYEVGSRTSYGYSMTMEHKVDCDECMKIFD